MTTPVLASSTEGGDSTVPVELNAVAAAFKVTVPTELPVAVDGFGHSEVADNAQIINNSKGPIKITNIQIDSQNDWTLIPFDADSDSMQMDEKKISFKMFEQDANTGVIYSQILAASESVTIPYDSRVALQSKATDVSPLKVVFTFGWHDGSETTILSDEGFYITKQENIVTIVGATSEKVSEKALSIPSRVTVESSEYNVESIGNKAFKDEIAIETLSIDNGVKMIGDESFDGCANLKTMSIPSSVNSIGKLTFGKTSGTISLLGRNNSDDMFLGDSWNGESSIIFPDKEIILQDISIGNDFSLEKGASKNLSIAYEPSNATNIPATKWQSSDTAVATVENGTVVGIKPGTSTITATVGNISKSVTVTVKSTLTGISIGDDVTLNKGETLKISPIYTPSDTTDSKAISYSSSKTSVATVDSQGLITAIGPGSSTITATGANTVKDSKIITVLSPLTDIDIGSNFTLEKGTNKTLAVSFIPVDTTDSNIVIWKSSNNAVATAVNGKVVAVSPGSATITATVGKISKSVVVTVVSTLTNISIGEDISLAKGKTAQISPIFTPADTTDSKVLSYESSNPAIASVDSTGLITAKTVGTATITASGAHNIKSTKTITVTSKLVSIDIGANFSLEKGSSKALAITYTPSDTTDNKTAVWTTSNANVATVENGTIKAIAPGTATITATVGSLSKSVVVTVTSSLVSINIGSNFSLEKGSQKSLSVSYNPSDTTTDKSVTWVSSNEAIVTVNNGTVTAVGVGSANITARVKNIEATVAVSVTSRLTGINIGSNITINKGTSSTIVPIYTPSDTTDSRNISYVSSNSAVATVNSSGVITGISAGTTTITGTGANGLTASKVVTVLAPLTDISIGEDFSLAKGSTKTLSVIYVPNDTTDNKTATWKSSNTGIATVSNGVVRGVKGGTATITATVGNISKSVVVTVTSELTKISLGANITLAKGKTSTIVPVFTPSDTTDSKVVVYESSNPSVATVTSTGLITAVNPGTAIITGTGARGIKATKTITVNIPVTSISLSQSEVYLELDVTPTIKIFADVSPSNATNSTVTWKLSSPIAATQINEFDNSITLTAIQAGTATLTATAGGKSVSIPITVLKHITQLGIENSTSLTLTSGFETNLIGKAIADDGTIIENAPLMWTSNNPEMLLITSENRSPIITVLALKLGRTSLTVSYKDVTHTIPVNIVSGYDKTGLGLSNGLIELTPNLQRMDEILSEFINWEILPRQDYSSTLDMGSTRINALAMIVNAMGKNAAINSGSYSHPFNDVPEQYKNLVGYAYNIGLVNGISYNTFGTLDNIRTEDFIIMISRGLGYGDDLPTEIKTAILNNVPTQSKCTQRAMILMTYNAMFVARGKDIVDPIPDSGSGNNPDIADINIFDANDVNNLTPDINGNYSVPFNQLPENTAIISDMLFYIPGAPVDDNVQHFAYAMNSLNPDLIFDLESGSINYFSRRGPSIQYASNHWVINLDIWGYQDWSGSPGYTESRNLMLNTLRYFSGFGPDAEMALMPHFVFKMLDDHYRNRADNSIPIDEEFAAQYNLTLGRQQQIGEYTFQLEVRNDSNPQEVWAIIYQVNNDLNPNLDSSTIIRIPVA